MSHLPGKLINILQKYSELLIWGIALLLLGVFNPQVNSNFSLCPLKNIGINCPGCGLGRSISYALHGNFKQSLITHPIGIPAIIILVHRILSLIIYHSKIHLKKQKRRNSHDQCISINALFRRG